VSPDRSPRSTGLLLVFAFVALRKVASRRNLRSVIAQWRVMDLIGLEGAQHRYRGGKVVAVSEKTADRERTIDARD